VKGFRVVPDLYSIIFIYNFIPDYLRNYKNKQLLVSCSEMCTTQTFYNAKIKAFEKFLFHFSNTHTPTLDFNSKPSITGPPPPKKKSKF
jgi:hypothetical protein